METGGASTHGNAGNRSRTVSTLCSAVWTVCSVDSVQCGQFAVWTAQHARYNILSTVIYNVDGVLKVEYQSIKSRVVRHLLTCGTV